MNDLRIPEIISREEVTIYVNGKPEKAYKGENVLSALIANGHKILNKSSISGEPRGALCGMGTCFCCAATVNGIPNVRTCMTEVEDKMEIRINE